MESKQYRVRHLNLAPKIINRLVVQIERAIRALAPLDIEGITDLAQLESNCDLLLIDGTRVPEEEFVSWVARLQQKVAGQGSIWTPAIILSHSNLDTLADLIEPAARENWYFDVVHPDHLESLPIRVANLLRIHDHMREILRYQDVLGSLQEQVEAMDNRISTLRGK